MLLEYLIASIISPAECEDKFDPAAKDSIINYQLRLSNGHETVRFIADIGPEYHSHIIDAANKAGWTVYINQKPDSMYPSYKTQYEFIFIPN